MPLNPLTMRCPAASMVLALMIKACRSSSHSSTSLRKAISGGRVGGGQSQDGAGSGIGDGAGDEIDSGTGSLEGDVAGSWVGARMGDSVDSVIGSIIGYMFCSGVGDGILGSVDLAAGSSASGASGAGTVGSAIPSLAESRDGDSICWSERRIGRLAVELGPSLALGARSPECHLLP